MARTPAYTLHDGFRMPKGFPVEGFVSGLTYRARPEDIFVSTYPKCGTTWMQHIVHLVLQRGEPLAADRRLTEAIPHLEEVGSRFVETLPEPRVIKTHLPFAMTPWHPQARYVYVARNPFDCVVSFFHHTRGFPQHYDFADGTFDDYFECFLAGEVDFGDYCENVGSWYARRDDDNLLLLTYERMLADPRGALVAVGEFLGPRGAAVREAGVLDAILHHSSFAAMSRDQDRWSSRRPQGMPPFVRKGIVGDWATHLSPAQARRLAARLTSHGAGLEALWPEVLESVRSLPGAAERA